MIRFSLDDDLNDPAALLPGSKNDFFLACSVGLNLTRSQICWLHKFIQLTLHERTSS